MDLLIQELEWESDNMEKNLNNLDDSLFEFAQENKKITDTKLTTKRIGYFKDAFYRFCKNKSSIVAACIIILLILFAIIVPIVGKTNYSQARNDNNRINFAKLLPKVDFLEGTGFWDGTSKREISENKYNQLMAYAKETNTKPITKVKKTYFQGGSKLYVVNYDSYDGMGMTFLTLTPEKYKELQDYQLEHDIQIMYPVADYQKILDKLNENRVQKYTMADLSVISGKADIWYYCNTKGVPILENGDYVSMYKTTTGENDYYSKRIDGDNGTFVYADKTGVEGYKVRVFLYNYFIYLYGHEPSFVFGTDNGGFDIFTRLASGARLSLILAFFVATINLIIGALYGSVAGYFGGRTDLIMERITDILGNIPFMVIATLFQLHLKNKVGAFPSLLFAFVLTGWIGTASTVRMQFYRYKNQEYVLAARTLGAKNGRLMFKHILPNALGTIITSSVLVIPSVIFSESSLTYLGIVNLEGDSVTSVGTMLAHGKDFLNTFPHIILFPALFISLLMITFNLFGNGLRDAFNPSLRGTED